MVRQTWLEEHRKTNLIYASPEKPQLGQVHFVRDDLAHMLWRDVKYEDIPDNEGPRNDTKAIAWVIGEHHSKSVRLPVMEVSNPNIGLRITLRYNFHDWNMSVESETFPPQKLDLRGISGTDSDDYERKFPNGYVKGMYWGYLFWQGFPTERTFGRYNEDTSTFSLAPTSNYEVWAVVRDVMNSISPST